MTCKETHASCLRYDEALGCLVYENNLGEVKPVKVPPPTLSALLNSACELVVFANNQPVSTVDLTPLLAKVEGSMADLDFRPGPCTLVWTPPDGSASETFDLSAILDKAQDGASYNQNTCVLSITNVDGETEDFALASILNKAQDSLNFNPTDCVLTYTDVQGDPAEVQLTALFNKMQFNGATCELTVPTPAGVKVFDLSQVLAKISVAYDPATHSLVVDNNGTITTQVINCSSLELIQNGESCLLRFTNAKGQVNDIPLPGSSFTRDDDTCTITVGNGKGGGFTFREGLDPVADIQFSLNDDKDLQLQVKDECLKIVLPDFVTDVTISDDNCELKIFKWCTDPQTIDIFAALGLTKNADGGFDIQMKDQICTFSPATLIVNPDNPNEFIFNNQFGQTTVITVPTVALDMDGATLNGSVLQLTYGGDGNPGSLNVDICAVVAQNCNATLVLNPDGSLTHTDNAGNVTQVPPPPVETNTILTDGPTSFTYLNEAGDLVTVDKCCTDVTENEEFYFVTDHNDNVAQICKRPVKSITFNGVEILPDEDGNIVLDSPVPPQGSVSDITDNGDNTFTHEDGAGGVDTIFMGGVTDTGLNSNQSAEYTDNEGNVCQFSTTYWDTSDPCFHYLVDSKTGTIIREECVDPAVLTPNEYIFSSDLYADMLAAGTISQPGFFSPDDLAALPLNQFVEFGPYCLTVTNPSECERINCLLNSRLGSYRLFGAGGAFRVSVLGTGAVNSPTSNLQVGKVDIADPDGEFCYDSDNGMSSSQSYQLNPGASRDHCATYRVMRLTDYIPLTDQQADGFQGLSIDTHRISVHCSSQRIC